MTAAIRLVEPTPPYTAANDNARSHRAPIMDRAKSNRLFLSPQENLLAIQTIERMDRLLSSAESDATYARPEDGHYFRGTKDETGDDLGQSVSVEVEGRSAEKVIEDLLNGPVTCHPHSTGSLSTPLHIHGRFKFNSAGIISGYRLNRTRSADRLDIWVSPTSPKYPDNVVTARDSVLRDHRGIQPGKTYARDIVTPANDNFDSRSCVKWIKQRMPPELYSAVYDATAGLGLNQIGTAAGFSGKQADAVGKDRIVCGLRQVARLLAEWDDLTCT